MACAVPLRAQIGHDVLVSSRTANAVHQYDVDGNFLGAFIAAGSGGLMGTECMLPHPDGSLLVTGFGNTQIKRYDGATGAFLGNFSYGYSLSLPSKMSIGPDGRIYVTQWGTVQDKVVRFELDGAFAGEFTAIGAPKGLGHYWDAQGRLTIALFGATGTSGTVHRFDSAGNSLGTFINSDFLDGPTDVWPDANGDVLVADWQQGTVLRYDSTGQYLGVELSGMQNPEGHDWLPNGDLLIGDWGLDAVHRFAADGTNLGLFTSGEGLNDPNYVLVRTLPMSSVPEHAPSALLAATPNPSSGPLLLSFATVGPHALLLCDAQGRVLHTLRLSGTSATVDLGGLPAGLYFLREEGKEEAGVRVVRE